MNIHNVISYVHNFDLSNKFQIVFEAHGSSYYYLICDNKKTDVDMISKYIGKVSQKVNIKLCS